jgi:hypothetical protein
MWVLIRRYAVPREYVAMPDADEIFTHELEKARAFESNEEARAEALGDERPIMIEDSE